MCVFCTYTQVAPLWPFFSEAVKLYCVAGVSVTLSNPLILMAVDEITETPVLNYYTVKMFLRKLI